VQGHIAQLLLAEDRLTARRFREVYATAVDAVLVAGRKAREHFVGTRPRSI